MKRRHFLSAALLGPLALQSALRAAPAAARSVESQTQWRVSQSEGLDAVAFLGALSGGELYLDYYAEEAAAFAPRLPAAVRDVIVRLRQQLEAAGVALLWPAVAHAASGGNVGTIEGLVAAFGDPETELRPQLMTSPEWNDDDWAQLTVAAPRLVTIFAAMRDAGFAAFRRELAGAALDRRVEELQRTLDPFDVIRWQRQLTGTRFEPQIDIVLLYFSKPHGVKVLGQKFLQSVDYPVTTTVRVAAHEMLHPPFPMDGPVAEAVIAALEADPLFDRIVREHDRQWGYTTTSGYLNENVCQALDQMISEELGVGRNPADRWRESDDGMHVLAAGLYGLLREDRWQESGGDIEAWLGRALIDGRLAPDRLHPVSARVLERSVDALWPISS